MTSPCFKTVAGKPSSSHHPCHGGPATYRILPASVFPAGARRSKIGSHSPRRCGAYGTCRQAFVACVSETLCAHECFIHQFLCDSTDDFVCIDEKRFCRVAHDALNAARSEGDTSVCCAPPTEASAANRNRSAADPISDRDPGCLAAGVVPTSPAVLVTATFSLHAQHIT